MDARRRSLERASATGDCEARLALLKLQVRSGDLCETAGRLVELCSPGGDLCEARLEVLELAISRDLTHGSWVKIYEHVNGEPGGLLSHRSGEWWSIQYWRTGWSHSHCPNLVWMNEWGLEPAGVQAQQKRRGLFKWTGYRTYVRCGLEYGLDWLASRLCETYPIGEGRRAWQVSRKELPAARALVTKLENQGRVGPAAWRRLTDAQERVAELEAELAALEGE